MLLNLTDLSNATLQEQISFQVIEKILSGELSPGDEINSIGNIARQHKVSKNTVNKAFNILSELDVIQMNNQMEYFVSDLQKHKREELRSLIKTSADQASFLIKTKSVSDIKKIEHELEVARQIQSDLLPDEYYNSDEYEIAAYIEPSKIVCGDFYDYFRIDDDKIGLVIADACGKGMPAAILISQIQAILKSELANGNCIKKIFKKLNQYLIHNTSNKNFTTLFYSIYNMKNNTLEFSNAGHNFPILIRSNGSIELLKTTAPALGLVNKFEFITREIKLNKNDTLLFYTDGVNETMNEQGELFGDGRIIELLLNNKNEEVKNILQKLVTEVNLFKCKKSLSDDKTLMLFKLKEEIKCS